MATNDRTTARFDGKSIYITEGSVRAFDALAKSLGYKDHTVFTCHQGGWMGATSYSGNTHGKEAVDLSKARGPEKVKNGRLLGIWLDRRLPSEGKWNEHIHGARLSPGASFLHSSMSGQQREYLAGRNGLVNGKRDDDFRPRYPNIRFVDDRVHERWIAVKATKGYKQPGGHDSDISVSRDKGWTWGTENIATVRVNNVEYLVTESMTFYRKADFAVYTPGFVTRPANFLVEDAPAYGRVAPDLNSKKTTTRAKGYRIVSVGYTKDVNGKQWERTKHGTYYYRESLKPEEASAPVEKPTGATATVAAYNVIVNRLSPNEPARYRDWKKGEPWATRAPMCAKMIPSASMVATAEAGSQKDAQAFSKALGAGFAQSIWGDGFDISQAVHHNTKVWRQFKTHSVTMTPAGPGNSHNIANLTLLGHVETGIQFWTCALHLISGSANDVARGKQVKSLVPQVLKITGTTPVLFIGDVNGAIGVGNDEVGKAFASFGFVDAENTDCAVVNPQINSYNGLDKKPRAKGVQLDRAFSKPSDIKFRKREVVADFVRGEHRTPWPSDHQPVLFDITIYRK